MTKPAPRPLPPLNVNEMILGLLDLRHVVEQMAKALDELCKLPNKKRPERVWDQAREALTSSKVWTSAPLTLVLKENCEVDP